MYTPTNIPITTNNADSGFLIELTSELRLYSLSSLLNIILPVNFKIKVANLFFSKNIAKKIKNPPIIFIISEFSPINTLNSSTVYTLL